MGHKRLYGLCIVVVLLCLSGELTESRLLRKTFISKHQRRSGAVAQELSAIQVSDQPYTPRTEEDVKDDASYQAMKYAKTATGLLNQGINAPSTLAKIQSGLAAAPGKVQALASRLRMGGVGQSLSNGLSRFGSSVTNSRLFTNAQGLAGRMQAMKGFGTVAKFGKWLGPLGAALSFGMGAKEGYQTSKFGSTGARVTRAASFGAIDATVGKFDAFLPKGVQPGRNAKGFVDSIGALFSRNNKVKSEILADNKSGKNGKLVQWLSNNKTARSMARNTVAGIRAAGAGIARGASAVANGARNAWNGAKNLASRARSALTVQNAKAALSNARTAITQRAQSAKAAVTGGLRRAGNFLRRL